MNRNRILRLAFALLFVLCVTASSQAVPFTYTGSLTSSDPVFRRPVETGDAFSPLIDDFGNPVLVPYDTFFFRVDVGGSYQFSSFQNFDGFLVLYRNTFNPGNSIANFVAANDDGPLGPGTSLFTTTLSANLTYILVTTAFDLGELGGYVNVINGPGTVEPIPEPATMILFSTGLVGVAAARKRRKRGANREQQNTRER